MLKATKLKRYSIKRLGSIKYKIENDSKSITARKDDKWKK